MSVSTTPMSIPVPGWGRQYLSSFRVEITCSTPKPNMAMAKLANTCITSTTCVHGGMKAINRHRVYPPGKMTVLVNQRMVGLAPCCGSAMAITHLQAQSSTLARLPGGGLRSEEHTSELQ